MKSLQLALAALALSTAAFGQFQTNQAAASLDTNNVVSSGTSAAITQIGIGNSFTLNTSSTSVGFPYDIAFNLAAQLNPGLSVAGQLVNININAGFAFLSGGPGFTVPGLPIGGSFWSQSITATPGALGDYTFQMYAIDPANPAGLALSQAATVNVSNFQPVTLTDDSFSNQSLATPFTFYGVTYTNCFIGSNGFITFGAGSTDFTESLAEFLGTQAAIRTNWDDFNPGAGGTVFFGNDLSLGTATVNVNNVPEFGTTNSNTFSATFGVGLVTTTYTAIVNPDAIVGLSPGANLGLGVALDLSTAPGSPIVVNSGEAPYQLFTSGNDLNGLSLNWALDGNGAPVAIF